MRFVGYVACITETERLTILTQRDNLADLGEDGIREVKWIGSCEDVRDNFSSNKGGYSLLSSVASCSRKSITWSMLDNYIGQYEETEPLVPSNFTRTLALSMMNARWYKIRLFEL
jgi:hypothetical protein